MSRAAGLCPVTMRAFAQAVIRARRPVTGGGLMGGRVGRKSPYCGQGQAAGLCPVTMRDFAQVIIRAFRPVTGRHKPAAQGCAVRLNMLEQAYGYHEVEFAVRERQLRRVGADKAHVLPGQGALQYVGRPQLIAPARQELQHVLALAAAGLQYPRALGTAASRSSFMSLRLRQKADIRPFQSR